jgi:hypothetical protein
MTSYKKLACFLSMMILLSVLPMFGQYQGAPSPGIVDGTSNVCATTYCWYALPGSLTSISASADGTICGVNSSNKVYCWDSSTLAWFEETALEVGSTTSYVGVGNARSVVVLTTASSDNVYYYNGSTLSKLAGRGYCNQIGIGGGNTDIWCLQGTYVYHFNGSGWTLNSGRLSNISVSATSATSFIYGVNSSNVLYGWTGTGWNPATGLGFTPSSAPGAVSGSSDGTVAVLDTSGNLHISEDGGGTWSKVASPPATDQLAYIAAPSLIQLLVLNTSNAVYHYTGLMAATTQTTSGSKQCVSQCPPGTLHSGTAYAAFPHGLNSGTTSGSAPPTSQMNIQHQDYSPSCDPIFTFGNPECNIALQSTVTCPVMGQLLNTGLGGETGQLITVHTKVEYLEATGQFYIFPLSKIKVYQYVVTDNCLSGTNIHVPDIWDTVPGPYWIAKTWLYGFKDPASGIGYWYWVWTIGGESADGSLYPCESAPGNPIVVFGYPGNGPVIGQT